MLVIEDVVFRSFSPSFYASLISSESGLSWTTLFIYSHDKVGLSGGAMVLGKLPMPGRPTNLDWSRARASCACSRCGLGCFDIFVLPAKHRRDISIAFLAALAA